MLKAAVLCSKRAPGLDYLLRAASGLRQQSCRSHWRERQLALPQARAATDVAAVQTFDIACVMATHPNTIDADVPVITRPMHSPRRDYDAGTLEILNAFGADIVLLLGYTYIVTDVLLSQFKILNVHDSDLRITRPDGERRYTGLHSTLDAIRAGEHETRSTLHVVTEKLDGGPIVSVSRPYPVAPFVHEAAAAGHLDIVKAYAYAQREWMMRDSWGSMVAGALKLMERAVA